MKKLRLGIAVLAGLAGVLPASEGRAEVRLRAANIHAPTQPYTLALRRWGEIFGQESNGEIKVAVFDSGTVVTNQQDAYSQVKIGTVDLTIASIVKDDVPALQIAAFPYAFRDYKEWRAFMDSPQLQKLTEEFRQKSGIRMLGVQFLGARHLTANKVVKSADELQGMKLRVPELPLFIETFRAMGALATPVAFQEVLSSLKTGVIDGQENPVPTIYQMKFYEAQKYIMLTGHLLGGDFWMMNDRKFRSLTDQQQQMAQRIAKEAIAWGEELILRQEKELIADLQSKGMTVIGPEQGLNVQSFVERVRANAWPKLKDQVGEAVLADLLAAEKK